MAAVKIHDRKLSSLMTSRESRSATAHEISNNSREDFDILHTNGILTKFKCKKCDNIFFMNPIAAEYGTACPQCAKKMNSIQIYQRYADYLDDGKYDVEKKNGIICVTHAECGEKVKLMKNVWSQTKCHCCETKRKKEKHIGKRIGDVTIIAWENTNWFYGQFKDGTIERFYNYKNFLEGNVKHKKNRNVNRIGEENVNTQGMKMKIIYCKRMDNIDVLFENGEIVIGVKYDDFKKGCLYPNSATSSRVGETNKNGQGVKMTIIAYRGSHDIDVRFETGEVAMHKLYSNFVRGKIKCKSLDSNPRVGEEVISNCGLKMKIVAYRNSEDIDVQFETGEITKHKAYYNFKRGKIICPSLK